MEDPAIFSDWTARFSSVQFSRSIVSNSLQPHGLQQTRLPCPSPTPWAYWTHVHQSFPRDSDGKESACNARDLGFTPGLGRCLAMPHGRRAWQSTKVFSPGESHGQWHLAGYGPWGHKESDTMKQWACMHTSFVMVVLPRIKCLNFMAAITMHGDFRASKIKFVRVSTASLLFSVKW